MRFSSVLLRLSGVLLLLLLLLATTTMTTTICRVVGEGLLVNAFPMQWTVVSTSLGRRTGHTSHHQLNKNSNSPPPLVGVLLMSASASARRNSDTTTASTTTTTTTTAASADSRTKSSTTTMPPRNAKHRRKKKTNNKKQQQQTRSSSRPLSSTQLAHHVAHQYLHGSGGLLRDRDLKAQKLQQHHQQQEHLQSLNRRPALVLNADYQPLSRLPLSLWHWQDAVKSVFSGKVTVVDVYDDVRVRAASLELSLPSVIALNEYVHKATATNSRRPAFTKRNVFLRDEYRCQYCNDMFHTRDLSLDHVVPRSRGGNLSWENAVTCCRKCNGRKGSLAVSELQRVGMKLLREPFVPSSYELAAVAGRMLPRRVHPTWKPYLGMIKTDSSSSSSSSEEEDVVLEREMNGGEDEMCIEVDL